MTDLLVGLAVLVGVGTSFFVSASAGMGGSLILVPLLALLLGTKEGIALAALLLAANNVVKMIAYRRVLPFRASGAIVVLTAVGALIGAKLLIAAPERLVAAAVVTSLIVAAVFERRQARLRRTVLAPTLALISGAASGFSGTSGPTKGVAIRSLGLDRLHMVGAAALVSGFGDMTKAAVFTRGELLNTASYQLALMALPLMLLATFAGRQFNHSIGERGYAGLFWVVMGGYVTRLLFTV